jgi:dTDP-glucose 4,6-dehydratase
MNNTLITGGAGFIGSNFILYMLDKHPNFNIINYDKLTYASNLNNLKTVEKNNNYFFEKGDIQDFTKLDQIIKKYNIDYIINFAAETHVDRSIYNGCREFVLSNSLGTQTLLDIVVKNGLKKMINVSTDEVYGSLNYDSLEKFTETTPIKPNMPYAAAKAGGDLLCNAYYSTFKAPIIVTHCSNNYGPYQFPEKLIPFFIFKTLNKQKVPVYGDGKNIRDWIHVSDHVKALELLLFKGEPGQVYNIGADNERTNLEVTKMILQNMDMDENYIEFIKDRPGHDKRYAIDATKIKKLGWQPSYTKNKFEQGLKETILWYKNNKEWVEELKTKKQNEMNKFQTSNR